MHLARFTPANRWTPPCHHRHRPNIDMDSPNPFSKGLKKLKDKLAASSPKQGGMYRSGNDQGGRETDVEGSEASQRKSDLHSEVEDVGSGTSREEVGL